ncbi:MAG: hypothetical protein MPJ78_03455 [Hyphomicrobiaceae bacterium]|nr:hypothetical protein [Hyphomicrobiaceae bacterium]
MIVKLLLRWVWVAIAFLVSTTIALIVLFSLGIFWLGDEFRAAAGSNEIVWHGADVFAAYFFAAAVGPALTALPGFLAVVVGEIMRIRSALYYTLTGGAAVAVIPLLARSAEGAAGVPSSYMSIFAAAGFVGGFTYWALAGARAG